MKILWWEEQGQSLLAGCTRGSLEERDGGRVGTSGGMNIWFHKFWDRKVNVWWMFGLLMKIASLLLLATFTFCSVFTASH